MDDTCQHYIGERVKLDQGGYLKGKIWSLPFFYSNIVFHFLMNVKFYHLKGPIFFMMGSFFFFRKKITNIMNNDHERVETIQEIRV